MYRQHSSRSVQLAMPASSASPGLSSSTAPPNASSLVSSSPPEAHYSFDFAQQVHIPADPLQPGPVYFVTPRKYAFFGVCCVRVPFQVRKHSDVFFLSNTT